MSKIILTSKVCLPSAKLLRDALQEKYNERILVTTDNNKVRNRLLFAYGKCINNNPLNSMEFINLCANKLSFSSLLNSNNIYSPIFYNNQEPQNSDYPVLIRKTLTGHGGQGIVLINNAEEFHTTWRGNYYWTKFIKTQFELRVHVFEGNIIKLFKKEFDGVESDYPIRNLDNGYHFALKKVEKYPKVIDLVQNKLNNLLNGIHYGLDLGYDTEKREYIIYECNTGCGLNTETAYLYANLIYDKLNNTP